METANLKRKVLELLANPVVGGENVLKTLSVLSADEVYVLTLMSALADELKRLDDEYAALLNEIITNHLLLRVSVLGVGRRDLKDVLNPYRAYSLAPASQPPQQLGEERKENKKRRFLNIF